jgi:hypothetical protein
MKIRNYGSLYILGMTSGGTGNVFRIVKKQSRSTLGNSPSCQAFWREGCLFFEIKMQGIGSLYILGMTSRGAGKVFRIVKK